MAIASAAGVHMLGFDDLLTDVNNMAQRLDDVKTLQEIAKKGAEPILDELINTTPVGIETGSKHPGKMLKAVATTDIKPVRGHGRVFMGPTRKALGVGNEKNDYYPIFVEFGHGGPRPARAHPWMRPAFDTRADEAYQIVREELGKELDSRKLR